MIQPVACSPKTVLMSLNTDHISEALDAVKNRRVSVKSV